MHSSPEIAPFCILAWKMEARETVPFSGIGVKNAHFTSTFHETISKNSFQLAVLESITAILDFGMIMEYLCIVVIDSTIRPRVLSLPD
jgi:hypothetical protein